MDPASTSSLAGSAQSPASITTLSSEHQSPAYVIIPCTNHDDGKPKDWIIENLEITDHVIAKGSYGVVKVAILNGKRVAAKIPHTFFSEEESKGGKSMVYKPFMNEFNVLKALNESGCPQVIDLQGIHFTSDDRPVVVTELMEFTLRTVISQDIGMDASCKILLEIAHGLRVFQSHDPAIMHKDLSSNNILVNVDSTGRYLVRIADFGSSQFCTDDQDDSEVGCPVYMPPEAFHRNVPHTPKFDVYSFGVLIIQMVTRNFPREVKKDLKVMEQTIKGKRYEWLYSLAEHCVSENPCDRPSSNEICQVLKYNLEVISSPSPHPSDDADALANQSCVKPSRLQLMLPSNDLKLYAKSENDRFLESPQLKCRGENMFDSWILQWLYFCNPSLFIDNTTANALDSTSLSKKLPECLKAASADVNAEICSHSCMTELLLQLVCYFCSVIKSQDGKCCGVAKIEHVCDSPHSQLTENTSANLSNSDIMLNTEPNSGMFHKGHNFELVSPHSTPGIVNNLSLTPGIELAPNNYQMLPWGNTQLTSAINGSPWFIIHMQVYSLAELMIQIVKNTEVESDLKVLKHVRESSDFPLWQYTILWPDNSNRLSHSNKASIQFGSVPSQPQGSSCKSLLLPSVHSDIAATAARTVAAICQALSVGHLAQLGNVQNMLHAINSIQVLFQFLSSCYQVDYACSSAVVKTCEGFIFCVCTADHMISVLFFQFGNICFLAISVRKCLSIDSYCSLNPSQGLLVCQSQLPRVCTLTCNAQQLQVGFSESLQLPHASPPDALQSIEVHMLFKFGIVSTYHCILPDKPICDLKLIDGKLALPCLAIQKPISTIISGGYPSTDPVPKHGVLRNCVSKLFHLLDFQTAKVVPKQQICSCVLPDTQDSAIYSSTTTTHCAIKGAMHTTTARTVSLKGINTGVNNCYSEVPVPSLLLYAFCSKVFNIILQLQKSSLLQVCKMVSFDLWKFLQLSHCSKVHTLFDMQVNCLIIPSALRFLLPHLSEFIEIANVSNRKQICTSVFPVGTATPSQLSTVYKGMDISGLKLLKCILQGLVSNTVVNMLLIQEQTCSQLHSIASALCNLKLYMTTQRFFRKEHQLSTARVFVPFANSAISLSIHIENHFPPPDISIAVDCIEQGVTHSPIGKPSGSTPITQAPVPFNSCGGSGSNAGKKTSNQSNSGDNAGSGDPNNSSGQGDGGGWDQPGGGSDGSSSGGGGGGGGGGGRDGDRGNNDGKLTESCEETHDYESPTNESLSSAVRRPPPSRPRSDSDRSYGLPSVQLGSFKDEKDKEGDRETQECSYLSLKGQPPARQISDKTSHSDEYLKPFIGSRNVGEVSDDDEFDSSLTLIQNPGVTSESTLKECMQSGNEEITTPAPELPPNNYKQHLLKKRSHHAVIRPCSVSTRQPLHDQVNSIREYSSGSPKKDFPRNQNNKLCDHETTKVCMHDNPLLDRSTFPTLPYEETSRIKQQSGKCTSNSNCIEVQTNGEDIIAGKELPHHSKQVSSGGETLTSVEPNCEDVDDTMIMRQEDCKAQDSAEHGNVDFIKPKLFVPSKPETDESTVYLQNEIGKTVALASNDPKFPQKYDKQQQVLVLKKNEDSPQLKNAVKHSSESSVGEQTPRLAEPNFLHKNAPLNEWCETMKLSINPAPQSKSPTLLDGYEEESSVQEHSGKHASSSYCSGYTDGSGASLGFQPDHDPTGFSRDEGEDCTAEDERELSDNSNTPPQVVLYDEVDTLQPATNAAAICEYFDAFSTSQEREDSKRQDSAERLNHPGKETVAFKPSKPCCLTLNENKKFGRSRLQFVAAKPETGESTVKDCWQNENEKTVTQADNPKFPQIDDKQEQVLKKKKDSPQVENALKHSSDSSVDEQTPRLADLHKSAPLNEWCETMKLSSNPAPQSKSPTLLDEYEEESSVQEQSGKHASSSYCSGYTDGSGASLGFELDPTGFSRDEGDDCTAEDERELSDNSNAPPQVVSYDEVDTLQPATNAAAICEDFDAFSTSQEREDSKRQDSAERLKYPVKETVAFKPSKSCCVTLNENKTFGRSRLQFVAAKPETGESTVKDCWQNESAKTVTKADNPQKDDRQEQLLKKKEESSLVENAIKRSSDGSVDEQTPPLADPSVVHKNALLKLSSNPPHSTSPTLLEGYEEESSKRQDSAERLKYPVKETVAFKPSKSCCVTLNENKTFGRSRLQFEAAKPETGESTVKDCCQNEIEKTVTKADNPKFPQKDDKQEQVLKKNEDSPQVENAIKHSSDSSVDEQTPRLADPSVVHKNALLKLSSNPPQSTSPTLPDGYEEESSKRQDSAERLKYPGNGNEPNEPCYVTLNENVGRSHLLLFNAEPENGDSVVKECLSNEASIQMSEKSLMEDVYDQGTATCIPETYEHVTTDPVSESYHVDHGCLAMHTQGQFSNTVHYPPELEQFGGGRPPPLLKPFLGQCEESPQYN